MSVRDPVLPADVHGSGNAAAPYIGLSYFTESQADLFFGREAERKKIIGNLRTTRLTLLYAASGVGKSSLLRAGVASRLIELARADAAPNPATYVPVVFGLWRDRPVEALIGAIQTAIAPFLDAESDFALPPGSLEAAVDMASDALDATLLICLDQFEEYFLYHAADDGFADEVARCVNRADLRVRFLISIRDDAYARLGDLFVGRIPNVYSNYLHLGHLSTRAAADAIRKPVGRYNELHEDIQPVDIEPELVDAVLSQVRSGHVFAGSASGGAAPAATPGEDGEIETPYLQLVMKRLWDAEASAGSRTLRLSTLTALGGAEEIVSRHLDAELDELSGAEQEVAAEVFRYLITPSRTKIAHDVPTLAEYTGRSSSEVGALLEKLSRGDARIVRPVPPPPGADGPPRFEVFHDVLAAPILDWRARKAADRLDRERRRLEARSGRLTAALASMIVIVLMLIAYVVAPGVLQRLELKSVDARFGLRASATPSDVIIVGIDHRSFARYVNPALGIIPRPIQARAIDQIWRGRPAGIGVDIIFDRHTSADAPLLTAIKRAKGHVVLATNAINSNANTTLFGVPPENTAKLLQSVGAQAGYVGFPPDADGRLRRFDYSVGLSPRATQLTTLPVLAARLTGAHIPKFGTAWIDYRGGPGTITTVPFADVVQGRIAPERFRGKIVLIGATDPGLMDEHPSPADGGSTMAGVEILANAAWTAKHGLSLNTSRGADFAAIVLLGLLPLVTLRLRPRLSVAVCAGGALLFLIAAQIAFDNGLIVSVVYPLVALVLSLAAVLGVRLALPRLSARRTARA